MSQLPHTKHLPPILRPNHENSTRAMSRPSYSFLLLCRMDIYHKLHENSVSVLVVLPPHFVYILAPNDFAFAPPQHARRSSATSLSVIIYVICLCRVSLMVPCCMSLLIASSSQHSGVTEVRAKSHASGVSYKLAIFSPNSQPRLMLLLYLEVRYTLRSYVNSSGV